VALPLLICSIVHGEDRMCWRVLKVVDAHGCWLRELGGEQSCAIDVLRIFRRCPLIMRACPVPGVANEAAAKDQGLDVCLIPVLPIGL
jgi:hypothetical protein